MSCGISVYIDNIHVIKRASLLSPNRKNAKFFKNGLNASKDCFGHGTPIVNYTDVYNKRSLKREDIKGLVSLSDADIKRFEVRKGDVFFTRTSETPEEVGLTSVLLEDIENCVFSGFILRARPFKNVKISLDYFAYCFTTKQVRTSIIQGCSCTTRALTNGRLLSEVKFALPPTTTEQTNIATALNDIDDLIQDLQALIAKKQDIKTGTMQQLLSEKMRIKGYVNKWISVNMGKTCRPQKGSQLNKNDMLEEGFYPVMNGGVSPSGYHSEYNTEANTIIISEGGNSCGFINYIHSRFWAGGHCYVLSPDLELFDLDFLYYILKFNEPLIMGLRTGSGLPNVKKSALNDLMFTIPDTIAEQRAIARVLSDMDSEIELLTAQLEKYKFLRDGMMQQLLTGKIRLI